MRYLRPFVVITALVGLATAGCQGGEGEGAEVAEAEGPSGEAEAEDEDDDKSDDRGELSMTIGPIEWEADRAEASVSDETLKIRAVRSDYSGERASRQELHLQLQEYAGPGDYRTGVRGSLFIGVGLDVKAAQAAGDDDEATAEVAASALSGADHMVLAGAKVTISSASDDEISGSFSWDPPQGLDKPAISGGTFRGVIDD